MGGGSNPVWIFSENSSVLVPPPVPKPDSICQTVVVAISYIKHCPAKTMWPKRSFFLQQKALVFFALLTHTFRNSQRSILNVLFWKFQKWAKSCRTIVFFLARKKVGDPSWTKWFNERISKSKHFSLKIKSHKKYFVLEFRHWQDCVCIIVDI